MTFCWAAETVWGGWSGAPERRQRSAPSHGGRSGPGGLSPPGGQRPAGGLIALPGDAGLLFRPPQQSERAVALGQVPPRAVEIARGRVDGAVAEQERERVQRHPGVQKLGGKGR